MRFLYFILLCVCTLFLPFPLALCAAILYALRFTAYEIIVLGMCVDAQFGIPLTHAFVYTLSFGSIMLCAELIKPKLSFYNGR